MDRRRFAVGLAWVHMLGGVVGLWFAGGRPWAGFACALLILVGALIVALDRAACVDGRGHAWRPWGFADYRCAKCGRER